jgi:hypothetical protein
MEPARTSGTSAQEKQLIHKEQEAQFDTFAFKQKVLKGDVPATKEQLDLGSRYYVLRVTKVTAATNIAAEMREIVKDFDNMVQIASHDANVKANRDLVAKFTPLLIQRFKEVFELDFGPNRVAVVNAATMLPSFARLKQEEIAEFFTSLIEDPKKHDAIRVHALKGMRDFFPARAFTKLDLNQVTEKANRARKDRELKRVEVLLKMVDRPMPAVKSQEELDAFRYIRKEAVASLAESQVPALSALGGKVEGPVVLGLVKVLAKKTNPEPSLQERLEAALGICQLKARDVTEYDPAIGIYLAGTFLTDFVSEYKKDLVNIQLGAKARKPTYFAWKVEAKRLEAGLNEMQKLTQAPAAQQLAAAARPVLQAMYASQGVDAEQNLRAVVQKLKPSHKTLFKDGKALLEFDFEGGAAEPEPE